jgi:DNA polymerase-1
MATPRSSKGSGKKTAKPRAGAPRKPKGGRKQGASHHGDLFLIDGNSLAYRAFYALPESMSTRDGRPTNAIYGFALMMAKVIEDFRPGAVIVAWDAGMSDREKIYEPYKAQRPPRPDLLSEQWPHLPELTEAFGFLNVKVPGFEADDVLGTLAIRAGQEGIPVTVLSGDRDVYQLVSSGVRVMSTTKGVSETKVYDSKAVEERYGVPPELVTDLMGLRGDKSDNIPGVPGIGDKTAAQLLAEYGSLEAVLENADNVSGAKRSQNLKDHADDARISKQLATIITDVDVEVDLKEVMATEPDRSGLASVAQEFELKRIVGRLSAALGPDEVPEVPDTDQRLEVVAGAGVLSDLAKGEVAVAVAASGDTLRWAASDGKAVVEGEAGSMDELVAEFVERPLIGHDFKNLAGGSRVGLLSAEGSNQLILHHDTMLGAYLLEPGRRSYELSDVASRRGLSASSSVEGEAVSDAQMELGSEAPSADPAADARLIWEIAGQQRKELGDADLIGLLEEVELPLIRVLVEMERLGIKLDPTRLAEIGKGFQKRLDRLEKAIYKDAGREFTIGSPQQLSEVLFEEMKLTPGKKGKNYYSTDVSVLRKIRDESPIVERIMEWRELSKLKSTYLDPLPGEIDPADGRIHTTFNQAATATGRLSSTDPNLQNIPIRSEEGRPIRSCFVATRGKRLLAADYDQVEMRILAAVAGDSQLRKIFNDGEDVHAATAAEVLGLDAGDVGPTERSKAKMVNYGIAYGLSAFGLAERLDIPQDEAAGYIENYFERFPAIDAYMKDAVAKAKKDGYASTLLGRRRPIPELRSDRPQIRSQGERLAINMPIQGTSADVIKLAMINSRNALAAGGMETKLILQIHDELLFEGPTAEIEEAARLVEKEMTGALDLDPTLTVEVGVGTDWLSAK